MHKLWFNPESILHKALIVTDDSVYVGSPDAVDVRTIEAALEKGDSPERWLGKKSARIDTENAVKAECEQAKNDITLHYRRGRQKRFTIVTLPDAESRDEALAAVQSALQLQSQTIKYSPLRAALAPGVFTAIAAAIGYAMVMAAIQLRQGDDVEIKGGRRLLKRVFATLLEFLGPTGTGVVCGIVVLLCLVWLVRRVANPPTVTTLHREA